MSSQLPSSPGQRFWPALQTSAWPGRADCSRAWPARVTVGVSRDNGWAWWFSFAFAGGLKNSTRNLSISFSKHERLPPLLTLSHRLSEQTRSFYSCLVVLCFPGTLRHPCLHFARVRSFHFVLLFRHFRYGKYVERVE